jgi:hypothetical protein
MPYRQAADYGGDGEIDGGDDDDGIQQGYHHLILTPSLELRKEYCIKFTF